MAKRCKFGYKSKKESRSTQEINQKRGWKNLTFVFLELVVLIHICFYEADKKIIAMRDVR
jgi:hypothetical protein